MYYPNIENDYPDIETEHPTLLENYFNIKPDIHHNAVTSTHERELDRSQGRAFNVNGDVFFSPNCQRAPTLPSPDFNPESTRDCFRDRVEEFHAPLWWHPITAYLAFLPLELIFRGVPFQSIFSIPHHFDRVRHGFILDPKIILQWNVIQYDLKYAVERLLSHHRSPRIRWLISTALGCTGLFRRLEDLREHVTNTRNWFSVFVAGLSYAIAVTMTIANDPLDGGIPSWFYILSNQQMEQFWLSGIHASSGGTFSPYVARAGILLNLLDPKKGQFSVDWLHRFHVPVWYPWGAKEAEASLSDGKLARVAPLLHQLQELNTFLTKTPEGKPSDDRSHEKPWLEFFAKRALRNEAQKAKETPQQRQSREDRQRKPPTKRCKVFIWRRDIDGIYQRESIFQSENETELDFYGRNQKIYDASTNCWDLCEEFGAVEADEFDANDDDYEFTPAYDPPSIASPRHTSMAPIASSSDVPPAPSSSGVFSDVPSAVASSTSVPSTVIASSSHTSSTPAPSPLPRQEAYQVPRIAASGYSYERYETSQILRDFLGFVHPLPLPLSLTASLDGRGRSLVVAISGLDRDDAEYFNSPAAPFAVEFLSTISDLKAPKNQSWDIASGNRLSLATAKRLGHLSTFRDLRMEPGEIEEDSSSKTKAVLYIFDFKQAATVPWVIAVPDPTSALFLCRLDPGFTDYDLARELLNNGIEFHTLVLLPRIPPPLPTSINVPWRLHKYQFTPNDYHAYVQQRSALLAEPRVARAALLRGGIVWRLAMATLSFDDVLHGPSAASTLHRRGISFETSKSSDEFCDDGLTQLEYNIICGLYHCSTGGGKQYSENSWWPTDSLWRVITSHSHWTEKAERFFILRLRELEGKSPQPLTASDWRLRIRASSSLRRVNTFMLSSSAAFIGNLPNNLHYLCPQNV